GGGERDGAWGVRRARPGRAPPRRPDRRAARCTRGSASRPEIRRRRTWGAPPSAPASRRRRSSCAPPCALIRDLELADECRRVAGAAIGERAPALVAVRLAEVGDDLLAA